MQRREFLRQLTALTALEMSGLAACGSNSRSQFVNEEAKPFLADKNKDKIFRAASLTFYNSKGFAHGALIQSVGDLYLCTAGSVVDMLRKDPDNSLVLIPGTGTPLRIDTSKFSFGRKVAGDFDTHAFYKLTDTFTTLLRNEFANGIQPLRLITAPNGKQPVAIARADTGVYLNYVVSTFDPHNNGLILTPQNQSGITCRIRNGTPVLRVVDGVPTAEVYGIVTAEKAPEPPGGNECSGILIARQNIT